MTHSVLLENCIVIRHIISREEIGLFATDTPLYCGEHLTPLFSLGYHLSCHDLRFWEHHARER